MKRVRSPHHGRDVVVGGRRLPAHLTLNSPRKMLRLADYVTKMAAVPTPPTSLDLTAKAAASLSNVYDNNSLGDCVIAGYYHVKGVATGNASGTPFVASDAQIIADYAAIGGYVPGDASTDQGCDEVSALDHWHATGDQAGTKIAGYILLDPSNVPELQLALYLFENHYFGVSLPDGWISPFPSGPGFVWDVSGDPDPNNGHCFMGAGYDSTGITICTWGMLGKLTYAAAAKYAAGPNGGQVYSILTPDAIAQGQQLAPNGIDWTTLQADLQALGAWPQP